MMGWCARWLRERGPGGPGPLSRGQAGACASCSRSALYIGGVHSTGCNIIACCMHSSGYRSCNIRGSCCASKHPTTGKAPRPQSLLCSTLHPASYLLVACPVGYFSLLEIKCPALLFFFLRPAAKLKWSQLISSKLGAWVAASSVPCLDGTAAAALDGGADAWCGCCCVCRTWGRQQQLH